MPWAVLLHLVGFVVDVIVGTRRVEHAKGLEIALLRHQLRLLQRRSPHSPHLSLWERLTLSAPSARRAWTGCSSSSRRIYGLS